MRQVRLEPKMIALVLLVVVAAAIGYDVYRWDHLTTTEEKVSLLREQVVAMRRDGKVEASRQQLASIEQQRDAAENMREGESIEMDNVELLRRVAGESDVEIVNLLRTGIGDREGSQLTYSLRLRAAMDKLITFLEILENSGLRGVAIEGVAAKRRGDVWETNLDMTGYFRVPTPVVFDGGN